MEQIHQWLGGLVPEAIMPMWDRFRRSPLSMRLAQGVFWSLAGAAISRGANVFGSIIVARVLGITAFGEFTIIQSTVGLFGTFAGLGLGITATKYIAEFQETDRVRCGRIIGLVLTTALVGSLAAVVALILLAPWLAKHALAAPRLAPILRYSSPLVLLSTLQGVFSGALAGFQAFKRVARVNCIGAMLGTPLMVGAALIGGLNGAVWGSVVQAAVVCFIGHRAVIKEAAKCGITLGSQLDWSELGILWRFSLPAFLSTILVGPVNWACNTLLANQPGGYREVALLNAANQWKNFLNFLPLMMTSVLIPMLSELFRAGRETEFRRLVQHNLLIVLGISLGLGLPLAIFARTIMGWYGPAFKAGVPVLLWALAGTAMVAVNNLLSRATQASGRAWTELTFSLLWAAVLMSGSFFTVPAYKALGVAVSHFIAAGALGLWQWRVVGNLFRSEPGPILELEGA